MFRAVLIWATLVASLIVPVLVAATSPLLAWREPVYIAAGFAGVAAMGLLLLQPLLAGGYLPGLGLRRSRRLHVWVGAGLVVAVSGHVIGLWITSPPDVVDALLFRSPTSFSVWGVVAMWALFAAAVLGGFRRRVRLRPAMWRIFHTVFATVLVIGSIVHASLIEGTMGGLSKAVLCVLVLLALGAVIIGPRGLAAFVR